MKCSASTAELVGLSRRHNYGAAGNGMARVGGRHHSLAGDQRRQEARSERIACARGVTHVVDVRSRNRNAITTNFGDHR